MKKGLLVLVLAAIVAGGAFALPAFSFSIGAGGLLGGDFGGGYTGTATIPYMGKSEQTEKNPYFGGGGFIFVDATYAELTFAFFGGSGTTTEEQKNDLGSGTTKWDFSATTLNIGLLLKYPFEITEKISVFPLLGFDYAIALGVKANGVKIDDIPFRTVKSSDYSAFWFKLGGGLDFSFTDKLFLRGEVLYGIRLKNKAEKDSIDAAKALAATYSATDVDIKARLGHGLTAKIALGYKLF